MMKATEEVLFVRPFHNPSPRFLTYFVVNLKWGGVGVLADVVSFLDDGNTSASLPVGGAVPPCPHGDA